MQSPNQLWLLVLNLNTHTLKQQWRWVDKPQVPILKDTMLGDMTHILCCGSRGSATGEKYFELKWGVFACACFACYKFRHLTIECPKVLHQPPPNALPPPLLQNWEKKNALPAKSVDTTEAKNVKPANQVQPNGGKGKNKGKEKMKESDGPDQDGFQQPKKVTKLKQHALQSCHWDASSPSPGQASTSASPRVPKNWVGVLKKGISICDSEDGERAMFSMGHDGMQLIMAPHILLVYSDTLSVHILPLCL